MFEYDYIIDAIDTISAKISLVERAHKYNIPIISAMGAGNKLDAKLFKVADISKTAICPLAKIMRKELRLRGINHLKVVPPRMNFFPTLVHTSLILLLEHRWKM